MVVIMVHWLVKRGIEHETALTELWERMTIERNGGLYREFLTKAVESQDDKFNTFSITDPAYTTYINIGFWKDVKSFDEAVGQYIAPPEKRRPLNGPLKDVEMQTLYLREFEFKIRERIILTKVKDRKGALKFPPADLTR